MSYDWHSFREFFYNISGEWFHIRILEEFTNWTRTIWNVVTIHDQPGSNEHILLVFVIRHLLEHDEVAGCFRNVFSRSSLIMSEISLHPYSFPGKFQAIRVDWNTHFDLWSVRGLSLIERVLSRNKKWRVKGVCSNLGRSCVVAWMKLVNIKFTGSTTTVIVKVEVIDMKFVWRIMLSYMQFCIINVNIQVP